MNHDKVFIRKLYGKLVIFKLEVIMKRFLKHILFLLISMSAICFVDLICLQDISAAEATINWVRGVPYDANGYRIIMSGDEISLVATTAKGYGSVVITVKTSNGKIATCKVTVPAPKVKK